MQSKIIYLFHFFLSQNVLFSHLVIEGKKRNPGRGARPSLKSINESDHEAGRFQALEANYVGFCVNYNKSVEKQKDYTVK